MAKKEAVIQTICMLKKSQGNSRNLLTLFSEIDIFPKKLSGGKSGNKMPEVSSRYGG
jgi:hypothetical protein